MSDYQMGAVESKFADIIWENEPITTAELIALCSEQLEWKRTTTYTVLKRLCERGIFQNIDSVASSKISRETFYSIQSEKFVEDTFSGSLPAFLAAFTTRKKLSDAEINELQELINQSRG